MTQPCHKDTTLNQQCCNSEHNVCDAGRQEDRKTGRNTLRSSATHHHTPPHSKTHVTTSCYPRADTTALPHPQHAEGGNITEGIPNPVRRQGQCEEGRIQSEHGGQHTHHSPPFNKTTTQTKRGRTPTSDGEVSNTTALHSLRHPPPQHTPHHPQWPPPPPRRGEGEQRIPHHTTREERHSPPAQCRTQQGTVHGTTAQYSQYALGVYGVGRTHWVGWTSSSTPHRHSTRHTDEEDGHHPLIHSHTVHVHTTNDQQ